MDLQISYYTISDENNYSNWHFLNKCHDRGLLYRGFDSMPWCPRCSTGISNQEIATEGYEEVTHTTVFVKFPLLDTSPLAGENSGSGRTDESLLVWTTTPWTLAANVAAAVHPELTYVKVKVGE